MYIHIYYVFQLINTPMKSRIVVVMLLAFFCCTQSNAQSFLENLGKTIKKEIKTEVGKQINKGINDLKENLKDKAQEQQKQEKQQQKQHPQPQQQEQKQSTGKPVVSSTDIPISKMGTWRLVIKDGKPYYEANDDRSLSKENYILSDVKYEHPDGVKPFMFTTAVATFKAKDGYYFDKQLKLNDQVQQAENTTGFKRIDAKTVKVYLTAFTDDMGYDARISPAMKAYKEKISKMQMTPVATAKMNTPLFDYWSKKDKWGEDIVDKFVANNMRAYYAYPTTEELFDINGKVVKDAKKSSYPSNYTILSVDILDEDLSDDIPGLVGEWCLVSGKKFIPKACLKDIKAGSKYSDGAPAQIIDSPFEFAGGSGTLEDPYLIQSAQQLNAIRKGPQNHYKLIADIDLSKWGNWVPIGASSAYGFMGAWDKAEQGNFAFSGSLDGNGHVISGMQIVINEETPFLTESANFRAYGLFGNLATCPSAHKIKNLGVVNFNIDVNYTNLKKEVNLYAGAICGGMNNGIDIYNCYSKGGKISIKVKGVEEYRIKEQFGRRTGSPLIHINVGGLCAHGGGAFGGEGSPRKHLEFVHIENCFNDSDIQVEVENLDYVIYGAGIIGSMAETHIHNCYNSGNITLPLELEDLVENHMRSYTAGISGYASIRELPGIYHWGPEATSFIKNCYNTGQIVGRGAAGIFFDSLSDIHIENCYNSGPVIANEFDHVNDGIAINPVVGKACAIIKYGKEYVRNATTDGNAVTGSMWKLSSTLGRKVLTAIPEDTHESKRYEKAPVKVGAFEDVDAVSWYAKGIQWSLDKNIISDASGKFSPDKTCTKADFYTFIWTAVGSPHPSGANPFSDVKATDSYYNAAIWAHEQGFISGSTFSPQTAITRGEFVVSLWKSLGCPEGIAVNQYQEVKSHQSDFGRALAWSHVNAVMGGTERYKFSPDKSCTRAEAINYIYRALK